MVNNNIPFPQADDFGKVIDLLNVDNEEDLKNNMKIKSYLKGVTDRQVNYYLSACSYLGLVNDNREFTKLGKELRKLDNIQQTIQLLRILLGDEIFGTAYLTQRLFGYQLTYGDLEIFIKKYYSNYSESSLSRRARTLSGWMDWIDKNIK